MIIAISVITRTGYNEQIRLDAISTVFFIFNLIFPDVLNREHSLETHFCRELILGIWQHERKIKFHFSSHAGNATK